MVQFAGLRPLSETKRAGCLKQAKVLASARFDAKPRAISALAQILQGC